jgi:hypothetical protein
MESIGVFGVCVWGGGWGVPAAVFAVEDALKGEVPVGLVVLKDGAAAAPEQVCRDLIKMVRDKIGAIASFRQVCLFFCSSEISFFFLLLLLFFKIGAIASFRQQGIQFI